MQQLRNPRNLVLGLCLVFLLALAVHLRVGAVLKTQVVTPVRADAADYYAYAHNLRTHGIYSQDRSHNQAVINPRPDAVRNPGYPFFLALLIEGPPSDRLVVRIGLVQALIGTLVVVLTFLLARAWMPVLPSLGASMLVAISPHLVNAGIYVLTEVLFSFFVVLLLCVIAVRKIENRPLVLLLAGALLGFCTLIRPTTEYFPIFLIALFFLNWPRKSAARASAMLLLGVAIVYGPWLLRNVVQIGQPTDPQLQINMLHHGMYPEFKHADDPKSFGFPYLFDPRAEEVGKSRQSVLAEIAARFDSEPVRYFKWYLLEKPYYLWSWNIIQGMGDSFVYPVTTSPYFSPGLFRVTHTIAKALHWPSVLLAVLFSVLVWLPTTRRHLPVSGVLVAQVTAGLLVYVTLLHMVGAPFPRYSVPFRPELYLAAFGGVYLLGVHIRIWMRARDHAQTTLT